MKSVPLCTVCEINPRDNGSSRLKDDAEVSFLPMAAVGEMGDGIIEEQTRVLSEVRKGYTPFQRGDVLIAKITPCFQNGKLAIATISREVGFGTTEFHVLRPHDGQLDSRYLFHFLRRPNIHEGGIRRMTGTGGQLRVPSAFFAELSIPLPPLAEQKRIAAVLNKADDLRGKRRQALATLDTLLQSVFLDMFGDPVTKRSPHPIKPLRPYLSAQSGKSSDDVRTEQAKDIPIYGGNGVNGWATKALFDEPVIVVGRVGQQCGITRLTSGPSWVTDNAIAVRVVDHSKLDPVYVAAALQRSPLRATVQHLDLPFVNQSIILDQPLPLPPLPLQRRFAKLTAAIEQRRSAAEGAAARLDALFAALQSAAFAGTLFSGGVRKSPDAALV